jgi:hypothetical protein
MAPSFGNSFLHAHFPEVSPLAIFIIFLLYAAVSGIILSCLGNEFVVLWETEEKTGSDCAVLQEATASKYMIKNRYLDITLILAMRNIVLLNRKKNNPLIFKFLQ